MVGMPTAICTGALVLLIVGPALAKDGNNGNHYGWYKNGKGGGVTHSAPGPEFGVGLEPAGFYKPGRTRACDGKSFALADFGRAAAAIAYSAPLATSNVSCDSGASLC